MASDKLAGPGCDEGLNHQHDNGSPHHQRLERRGSVSRGALAFHSHCSRLKPVGLNDGNVFDIADIAEVAESLGYPAAPGAFSAVFR